VIHIGLGLIVGNWWTIQNVIIPLIAGEVEAENLAFVKNAKCFSIIVDCTSDVTHKEQLTIVLRTVTIVPGKATQVGENFFWYLQVFDTAGKDLLEAVLNGAKDWDCNISDHCDQL
jgi:hypothetical protein